jgi:UDP-N-acetylmuramoylalanine-D-glutamate ligase
MGAHHRWGWRRASSSRAFTMRPKMVSGEASSNRLVASRKARAQQLPAHQLPEVLQCYHGLHHRLRAPAPGAPR